MDAGGLVNRSGFHFTANPEVMLGIVRTRSQAVARIADRTASQETVVISDCLLNR